MFVQDIAGIRRQGRGNKNTDLRHALNIDRVDIMGDSGRTVAGNLIALQQALDHCGLRGVPSLCNNNRCPIHDLSLPGLLDSFRAF